MGVAALLAPPFRMAGILFQTIEQARRTDETPGSSVFGALTSPPNHLDEVATVVPSSSAPVDLFKLQLA